MATLRQRKAVEKVLENNGNVSRAMIEAGYPPATAKNPQQLTRSKGWAELMEKFLPDKHLTDRHREMLDAPRIVRTFKKGDLEVETEETDPSAVKALEMAYKIKNKFPKQGDTTNNNVIVVNVTREGANKYNIRPDGVQPRPVENL